MARKTKKQQAEEAEALAQKAAEKAQREAAEAQRIADITAKFAALAEVQAQEYAENAEAWRDSGTWVTVQDYWNMRVYTRMGYKALVYHDSGFWRVISVRSVEYGVRNAARLILYHSWASDRTPETAEIEVPANTRLILVPSLEPYFLDFAASTPDDVHIEIVALEGNSRVYVEAEIHWRTKFTGGVNWGAHGTQSPKEARAYLNMIQYGITWAEALQAAVEKHIKPEA